MTRRPLPRRRARSLAAAAGLLVLALPACAPDGTGGDDVTAGPVPDEDLGPISRGLQEAFGGQDPERQALDQARVEEAIARCMKDEGFDYEPVPYAVSRPADAGTDGPAWGTEEFAAEYGYGITTAVELGTRMVPVDIPPDPNAERVDAMSPSARQTYWSALYGDLAEGVVEMDGSDAASWDWATAGCSGRAQHEVYEVTDSDTSSLVTELASLYDSAFGDPRYVAAQRAWAACMADSGYDYETPDAPQQAIDDELTAAMDATTGAVDPSVAADLREREMATALVDVRCRESSTLDETLGEVTALLEEDFYALHRDEVDAWLAEQGDVTG